MGITQFGMWLGSKEKAQIYISQNTHGGQEKPVRNLYFEGGERELDKQTELLTFLIFQVFLYLGQISKKC